MKLKFKIWLDNAGKAFGEGPYQLLQGVREHGSLAQAAKDLNMSYSRAHGLMKQLSHNLGYALIDSQAGGAGGGGTVVTAQALDLMSRYEAFMNESSVMLQELYQKHFGDADEAIKPAVQADTVAAIKEDTERPSGIHDQRKLSISAHLEPLHLRQGDVVSLVGGGGKSSIMYALAEKLAADGAKVLLTTTTKIFLPDHGSVSRLLVSDDTGILEQLPHGFAPRDIVAVGNGVHDGKLEGLSPELIDRLSDLMVADFILVEADGAAGHPFKAPSNHEPVIPRCTTMVLNIVGLDVLGKPLNSVNCHRPEEIARLSGLNIGDPVDGPSIAKVLFSEQGGRKNVPRGAKWLPVINKIDSEQDVPKAVQIARALVHNGVQDVVFASTLHNKLQVRLWSKDNV